MQKTLRRKLAQLDQGAARRPVWVEQSKHRVNRRLGGGVREESPEREGLSRFKARKLNVMGNHGNI